MGGVVSSIGKAVGSIVGAATGAQVNTKAQERAAAQAEKRAAEQAELQKQEINRANAKSPDMGSLVDRAAASSKLGAQGTILTGSQGVDEGDLLLGKKSLLGS